MNLVDRLLDFLKLIEVKAEEEGSERRASASWPRRVSFNPFPLACTEEESTPEIEECVVVEEYKCEEEYPPSFLGRRLGCMASGARHGLKEGALSGVFFGGGFGLYKYIDSVFINPEGGGGGGGGAEKRSSQDSQGGGGGSSGGNNDSTVNDNIIFLCACNSAIFMGVLCTIVCSLKNTIYCS